MGNLILVLLEIYCALQQWKNLANRSRIDKVIAMVRVAPFFWLTVYVQVWGFEEFHKKRFITKSSALLQCLSAVHFLLTANKYCLIDWLVEWLVVNEIRCWLSPFGKQTTSLSIHPTTTKAELLQYRSKGSRDLLKWAVDFQQQRWRRLFVLKAKVAS